MMKSTPKLVLTGNQPCVALDESAGHCAGWCRARSSPILQLVLPQTPLQLCNKTVGKILVSMTATIDAELYCWMGGRTHGGKDIAGVSE